MGDPGRTTRSAGPFCDQPRTSDRGGTCRLPAGYRTDHPGHGNCYIHRGNLKHKSTGSTSRYSGLKHRRLQRHLQHLHVHDQDIMDLRPEVQLLRALIIDYVETYDAFTEALMAWYDDRDSDTKPRRIPDIQEVGTMLDKVSRIVQRIHTIEQTGSITLPTFHRVMEAMGIIVASHVESTSVLQVIEDEWKNLPLDVTDPNDKYDQIVEDEEDEKALVIAKTTKKKGASRGTIKKKKKAIT